jgi:hypothetical protein
MSLKIRAPFLFLYDHALGLSRQILLLKGVVLVNIHRCFIVRTEIP